MEFYLGDGNGQLFHNWTAVLQISWTHWSTRIKAPPSNERKQLITESHTKWDRHTHNTPSDMVSVTGFFITAVVRPTPELPLPVLL